MFDPKTTKYPYTEYTDGHYINVTKDNGLVFDKNYPYIDKSKAFRFKAWWFMLFCRVIVLPVVRIRMGLRIKGRRNIKKYKSVIKNGIISCCNHVHYWDFLGILYGIRPYKPKFLAWAKNIRGGLSKPMRLAGGIPIPEDDLGGQIAYSRSIRDFLNSGGWLHIYAEGSMWEYYKPIRPFKRGTASYAVKYNKPILPMAYTYRRPGFIRRKIFKQIALFTLNIGAPIFRNEDLPYSEQEYDLTKRAHEEVCKLANINPSDNIYGPIFNNSKKIDY